MKLRLSEAQISALECAGLGLGDQPCPIEQAWTQRDCLEFDPGDRDKLFSAITELSNAEDATAERFKHDPPSAKLARQAARALGNLASKILRAKETL